MFNFKKEIIDYFNREKEVIDSLNVEELNDVMNVLYSHYLTNSRIFTFGNGGSSATASHMVVDFNKGACTNTEKKFNCICLNDNIPTIMALANDISFEDIFYRQLLGKIKKSDLFIIISGSGNSKNVVKAAKYIKSVGCDIIALTGYDGGELYNIANFHMHVPVDNMQITEDIHMAFDHCIMSIFYKFLRDDNVQ